MSTIDIVREACVVMMPGTKRIEIRRAPLLGKAAFKLLRVLHGGSPVCAVTGLSRAAARDLGARMASANGCPLIDCTNEGGL